MTKLNPFILVAVDNQINPSKYTPKQLEDNADTAYDAAAAAHAAASAVTASATYWLAEYFTKTNENKQDYIDELENTND